MPVPKTYHNPINGEYTKILESAAETEVEYTLLEVSLKPGGGNPIHYHKKFTEEFFAVKGTLGIWDFGIKKKTFTLNRVKADLCL